MPKKKVVRKKPVKRSSPKSSNYKLIGYTVVVIGCLLLFFVVKTSATYLSTHVLGAATFLSDRGGPGSPGDSGQGNSGGDSNNPGSQNSNSAPAPQTQEHANSQQAQQAVQEQVHMNTIQSQQREVNQGPNEPENAQAQTVQNNLQPKPTESLEVETEDNTQTVNLSQQGTTLQVLQQNGKLQLQARQQDGTTATLSASALTQINNQLKANNIPVIGQKDSNTFTLNDGTTQADTAFPLSVDLATNQLTVTTPHGVAAVKVLPTQAINNLISQGVITSVDESSTASPIQLTEVNNQPAFQIPSTQDKKVLGIIPVTVHKTVNVSSQTGNIITTQETFTQKLLDLISL